MKHFVQSMASHGCFAISRAIILGLVIAAAAAAESQTWTMKLTAVNSVSPTAAVFIRVAVVRAISGSVAVVAKGDHMKQK